MPDRWHRWVDHTAEVELEVGAESLGGLAVEAGRALGLLLLRDAPAEPAGAPRTLEVESADREALLVDWLNEILFVAETELWVPLEFAVREATANRLRTAARGVPVQDAPSIVKAATFHGLRVTEEEGEWRAEVIFDV